MAKRKAVFNMTGQTVLGDQVNMSGNFKGAEVNVKSGGAPVQLDLSKAGWLNEVVISKRGLLIIRHSGAVELTVEDGVIVIESAE